MNLKFTSLIILVLLTSCNILPNIKNDINDIKFKIPNSWKNINLNNNKANNIKIPENWWILFKDEKLNKIVDTAIANNKDVKIALLNIQKQLINSGQSVANMIPNFSGRVDYNRNFNSQNGYTQGKSSLAGGFDVSYQIDLFGQLLNQYKATNLMTRASAEYAYSTGLTIIEKTITKYWTIAFLNETISLYQEALNHAQQILKISKIQYQAGSISKMQYLQAQEFVITQKQKLANTQQQKETTYNDLTTLVSLAPNAKLDIPNRLPQIKLPPLPTKYPLIVLANRPDVRQAQLKLEESLLNIKVAVKNFFPDIIFNAGLSNSGLEPIKRLSKLFDTPSKILSLGFTLPVLQWPKNYLKFKSKKLEYAEDLISFKSTVAKALAEVENAFYNFDILENNYKLAQRSYINNKQIEKAMKVRYEVGEESFDNYLQAKNNTIKSHSTELEYRLSKYQAYIAKILALGGSTRANYKASELKKAYDNDHPNKK